MTDTKPDLTERARETSPQRRRGMWLWILGVVVVAAGVLATVDLQQCGTLQTPRSEVRWRTLDELLTRRFAR
jgi:hypothetical protein